MCVDLHDPALQLRVLLYTLVSMVIQLHQAQHKPWRGHVREHACLYVRVCMHVCSCTCPCVCVSECVCVCVPVQSTPHSQGVLSIVAVWQRGQAPVLQVVRYAERAVMETGRGARQHRWQGGQPTANGLVHTHTHMLLVIYCLHYTGQLLSLVIYSLKHFSCTLSKTPLGASSEALAWMLI